MDTVFTSIYATLSLRRLPGYLEFLAAAAFMFAGVDVTWSGVGTSNAPAGADLAPSFIQSGHSFTIFAFSRK